MNINDLVYIYMYDLEATLLKSADLVTHRFGKIKAIKQVDIVNSADKALIYEVELTTKDNVSITTYDTVWSVITLDQLEDKITTLVEDEEIRDNMLEQISKQREQA